MWNASAWYQGCGSAPFSKAGMASFIAWCQNIRVSSLFIYHAGLDVTCYGLDDLVVRECTVSSAIILDIPQACLLSGKGTFCNISRTRRCEVWWEGYLQISATRLLNTLVHRQVFYTRLLRQPAKYPYTGLETHKNTATKFLIRYSARFVYAAGSLYGHMLIATSKRTDPLHSADLHGGQG